MDICPVCGEAGLPPSSFLAYCNECRNLCAHGADGIRFARILYVDADSYKIKEVKDIGEGMLYVIESDSRGVGISATEWYRVEGKE
jgi:hypothetical protein